jgi:hypothetical protein
MNTFTSIFGVFGLTILLATNSSMAQSESDSPGKSCEPAAHVLRVVSLVRQDKGSLVATFDLQNNSNEGFRMPRSASQWSLTDDSGEVWSNKSTSVWRITFIEGSRAKFRIEFGRRVGGQEAKSANLFLAYSMYGHNPVIRCRYSFQDVPIEQ